MMHEEFEKLAGYEVSDEDYHDIIEPMYMATNMKKEDFIKCLDRKRFALPTKKEMIREMRKEAKHLFEICGHSTDYDSEERLEKLAKKYLKRFYGVDWSTDMEAYALIMREYEYPEIQRGCTFPKELILGRGNCEYERITLVKVA